MSLLVTGSIGIDTVTSPHGHAEGVLGGTAVYFSFAAMHYTPVRLVAAVGDDFPPEFHEVLASRDIDLAGLEIRKGSKTFRWSARYDGDMNEAQTIDVRINVLAEACARVPETFADSGIVFLAVTHPTAQRELLAQLRSPELAVCDTVNFWIETERESLRETLQRVNGVIINDAEARQLTERLNLIEAGEAVLSLGPKFVIIKKGEHGALLIAPDGVAAIPAFPTKLVRDPTGAGDSFAGGFMGYLAQQGRYGFDTLREALVRGTVAASFAIEDFSLRRLQNLTRQEVNQRVDRFLTMLRFE